MGIETRISSGARETLAIFVGYVLAIFRVSIFLNEAKIDYVNVMLSLPRAHQKIIWFYISVQVKATMNILNSLDHLVS